MSRINPRRRRGSAPTPSFSHMTLECVEFTWCQRHLIRHVTGWPRTQIMISEHSKHFSDNTGYIFASAIHSKFNYTCNWTISVANQDFQRWLIHPWLQCAASTYNWNYKILVLNWKYFQLEDRRYHSDSNGYIQVCKVIPFWQFHANLVHHQLSVAFTNVLSWTGSSSYLESGISQQSNESVT